MKNILITTLAAVTLSTFGAAATADITFNAGAGAGNLNFSSGGQLNGSYTTGNYQGATSSFLEGSSGAQSTLNGKNLFTASSSGFTAGGALVGSVSTADFTNPAQPMQNSTSYQVGANYQQNDITMGGLGTGQSISGTFQNFETWGTTDLYTSAQAVHVDYGVAGNAHYDYSNWDLGFTIP